MAEAATSRPVAPHRLALGADRRLPPASHVRRHDNRGATGPTNRGPRRVDGRGATPRRAGNANGPPDDLHGGPDSRHDGFVRGRGSTVLRHHSGGPPLTRRHIGCRGTLDHHSQPLAPTTRRLAATAIARRQAVRPTGPPVAPRAHRGLRGGGRAIVSAAERRRPVFQLLTDMASLRAGAEMLGYLGRQGRRRDPGPQVPDGFSRSLAGHPRFHPQSRS